MLPASWWRSSGAGKGSTALCRAEGYSVQAGDGVYKGAAVEKRRMMPSFGSMFKQIMKVDSVRAPHQVLEAFLMKCHAHHSRRAFV